uniref:Heterokaryon incompatibility domain-containing protein n=1 Tax=Bionectria ochroleuca TaxID=29856 RepID=A0A0B7KPX0_BIOOC
MRLLEYNNGEVFLTNDLNRDAPRYATLPHTHDGLQYFWIDTCCIDKSNHTELHEAINSMFRWYQNADRCYVFLADVTTPNPDTGSSDSLKSSHHKEQNSDKPETSPSSTQPTLRRSRWFTHGWTLQELVAPASVEFFTKQGHWLGDKASLEQQIHQKTVFSILALRGAHLSEFDGRQTAREEDWTYCLLGIFDVFMPLIYGEGKSNAVRRLRKKTEKGNIIVSYSLYLAKLSEVKHHTWQELKPTMTIPFNRDPDFVDRSDILERINEQSFKRAGRTALVGLGGVGKSQLAIEFAYRIDREPAEVWVF